MANTTGYGYLLGPAPQFFDANGKPLVGGKLFVYIAGTTTTAVTYSDFNRTENTSPVILNDLGSCILIVPSANLYKIVLYDRKGNLLITRDNVRVSIEYQIIYTNANKVESSDSTVDVTETTDTDTGIITYDISIKGEIDRATEAEKGLADAIVAEKSRAEGVERTLSESIADETKRAIEAEKASRTGIVAGDNITVEKTVGADGQDVYTVSGANIDVPVAGTASPLMDGKASVGNSLKYAREDHVHPTDTSREDKANKTTVVLGTSDSKYPTDKAVAEFVNSSIATNTANYISNNGEPFTSVEQLNAYSGTVTNNDYAFVTGIDSEGNTYYDRYKATVSGSTVTWALEYRLNNSSFTAAQWSAINSGITSALVAKIHEHSNKDVLDGITSSDVANWNSKLDKNGDGSNVTVGFTEAANRTNIATGSKLSTLFGQIRKWFTDLKSLAFKDKVGTGDVESGTYGIDISGNAATASEAASGSALETAINAKADGDNSVAIFDGYMRRMNESTGWRRLAYKQFNDTNTNLNALFRLYLFGSNNDHIGLGDLIVNIRFNDSGSAPELRVCYLIDHKPLHTSVKVKVIGVAGNAVVELWFRPLNFSFLTLTCLGNGLAVTQRVKDWTFRRYLDANDPEPVEDIANNIYVFSGTVKRIQLGIDNPISGNLVAMNEIGLVKDSGIRITSSDIANWNSKQTKLTFDNAPRAGSNNPVTSDGIKTALNNYVEIYKGDSSNFHVKNNEYYSFICRTNISDWEKIQADFFCANSDSSTVGKFNIFATLSTTDTSLHTPERVAEFGGIVWDYNYKGYNSIKYRIYVAKSGDNFYFYAKRNSSNDKSITAFRSCLLYKTNSDLTDNVSADLDDATWQTLSLVEMKNVYHSTTQERLDSHKNDTTVHITEAERNDWNAKQSALTFDTTPTSGSTNPVTSDGIKTALEALQSNIDTAGAKGIVINEINGENVICFE